MYLSATMRDHVIYESRLELSRLITADFDRAVHRILAQPFLLKAKVDGKIRKHIPDYFLAAGPVVIDVKPEHLLTKPTVAYTFAWTRRLVEARGWQYEVWSGSRLRSWRTCGSLLATGVPGCSTRPCLTKSAAPTWRAARWGKCCVAWTAMIQRLERDIGGSLLERAERGRPMTPTALGEEVLAALHRTSQPGG
jgi:hypothetical protein